MRKKVFIILAVLVLVLTAQTLDCIQSAMSSAREVGRVTEREAGQVTGSMMSENIRMPKTCLVCKKVCRFLQKQKGFFQEPGRSGFI